MYERRREQRSMAEKKGGVNSRSLADVDESSLLMMMITVAEKKYKISTIIRKEFSIPLHVAVISSNTYINYQKNVAMRDRRNSNNLYGVILSHKCSFQV